MIVLIISVFIAYIFGFICGIFVRLLKIGSTSAENGGGIIDTLRFIPRKPYKILHYKVLASREEEVIRELEARQRQ